jgi:hypothetical protein
MKHDYNMQSYRNDPLNWKELRSRESKLEF